MKHFPAWLIAVPGLALGYAAFLFWPAPEPAGDTKTIAVTEFGERSQANLIGVQVWLTPADYQNAETFRARLETYLEEARRRDLLTEKSIVVFPEHIGTWLVASHAPAAVYGAETTTASMAALIAANPFSFASAYFGSTEEDRTIAAIFRMRQRAMLEVYQEVFGGLARDYGVSVVAGSIVAEAPAVQNGHIARNDGPLYNMSAVFFANGSPAEELVLKAYPIPSETPFTRAADPAGIPVFDTPAGRLGVLICADSWHPDVYDALAERRAEIVAAPAFLQPDGVWGKPWGGYTTPWPEDVSRGEARTITEGEAWQAHSMPARAPAIGAKAGITAFLRGDLWDLGASGRALMMKNGETALGDDVDGPALAVVWF